MACGVFWVEGPSPALGFERQGAHKTSNLEGESHMAENDRITKEEGTRLISLARETIEARLPGVEERPKAEGPFPEKFTEKRGTFVTLTLDGGLRGCIGHIIPQQSIVDGVKENAVNAAFRDPRFPPLTAKEWDRVCVEVSVLTDPKPLPYDGAEDLLQKLRPGVDGVILRKGMHQATFLPQVWDQLPMKEDFLTHLCLKAGLDGDTWRREPLEVSTYQVQAFEEE